MKIESYKTPKSSFLSIEKDTSIIIDWVLKNKNLKKLLYYTTRDALDRPPLNDEETFSLIEKNIKNVPKIKINDETLIYLCINFDDFVPNGENPEFRNNTIDFNIICPYECWNLKDFQLRPFRIAAEIDSMFNNKHLSGIGTLEFRYCGHISINDGNYGGITLSYHAIHGEDDKKYTLNPIDQAQLENNFNELFND